MKNKIIGIMAVIMAVVMIAPTMAVPMHIDGNGSGVLQTTYNNGVYNDAVNIQSADFTLTTDYDTNTVDRDFQIKDSYNSIYGGCGGVNPAPAPNASDFGMFRTIDLVENDVIYHDLTFEKRYAQYLPAEVKLTQNLDFTTRTMNLYSRDYATGDWSTTQQVVGSNYNNFVWAREYNANKCDKLHGDIDFSAGTTHFHTGGSSTYVPGNAQVYVGDSNRATMTGVIGGLNINFAGNLYNFDHTNIPHSQGFDLNIVN